MTDDERPPPSTRAANDFERACRLIGGSNHEIGRMIGNATGRRVARWAVGNWRNETTPVPGWALYAAFDLAGIERVLRIVGGSAPEELPQQAVQAARRRRRSATGLQVRLGGLSLLVVAFMLAVLAATPAGNLNAFPLTLAHAVHHIGATLTPGPGQESAGLPASSPSALDAAYGPSPTAVAATLAPGGKVDRDRWPGGGQPNPAGAPVRKASARRRSGPSPSPGPPRDVHPA